MKVDEAHQSFLGPLATAIVIRNSALHLLLYTNRELFEVKQTTICHEYGLIIEPKRGQIRHSVLSRTAFSRFCWRCCSERIFWNILGKLFSRCSLPCEQAPREKGKKSSASKASGQARNGTIRAGRWGGKRGARPQKLFFKIIVEIKPNYY